MIRSLLWALSLAALAAGGWHMLGRDLDARAVVAPGHVAETHDRIGLRRMLAEHDALAFADLVIGRASGPELRDFRGRILREGRLKPAFGQARRLCVEGRHAPDCWAIAHLEIDGRAVDPEEIIAEGAALAAAADALAPGDAGIAAPAIETADIPDKAPALAEAKDPAVLAGLTLAAAAAAADRETGAEPGAAQTGALPATHRVARPVINTRAGPGTASAVVARLKEGAELALVESQDGWGRFVLLGGEREGERVWAALSIVEAVP